MFASSLYTGKCIGLLFRRIIQVFVIISVLSKRIYQPDNMLIKVKYHNVKKFVHLNTSDTAEEFIVRVRTKFMAEGDEKITFRDSDETEIDSEDLIEYILEKQSDSFILNICKETSVATGSSSMVCSTAAIDSLSDSTSSACDDVICILPIDQYLEGATNNSASTSAAYDNIDICLTPVKEHLKTAKENVSASTSSACNNTNICTSPAEQYPKIAKENVYLLSQDPKKVVNEALNETAIGRNLLEEYEVSATLKPESRRALVRLIVEHIQEQHGIIPSTNVKIFYAKGIVQNFPTLRDPSTAEGYELFYNPKDRSGYLSWRLRTVNRITDSYNNPKKAKIQAGIALLASSSPENPRVPDSQINENQEKEIVEWLKNASPTTQLADIEVRMRQSLKYRRTIILDPKLSKNILIEFPRFLDTPGLIQKDFEALMPEHSSKLIENWQEFESRILKVSEITIKKKSKDIALWDKTIQTLFLLLHLLPPTAKGKKKPNRATIDVAMSRLISFHQIGLPLPSEQELTKISLQPFLLAVGSNQQAISNFYVVFDGKLLPCSAHMLSISAFDTLFKAHYVFGCKYEESLEIFWKFVQMIFYDIDVDNLSFTPKMHEIRARLFNVIIE